MSEDHRVLSFGEYELDLGRQEVRRAGLPLDLQPTPLRLLLYLAEHRDRTVPKRELLDAIWPDVVVGDASLASALAVVREVLHDDGQKQRVIRTRRGSGYRFVAEVSVDDCERLAPTPRRSRRTALLASLVGVLLLAAGLGVANRVAIGTWLALTLPRVLSRPIAQQIGFATTSDGVRIAYATAGRGPPLVFVLGWLTHLTEGIGSPLYDAAGVVRWHSRNHLLVRYDGRGFGLSDRNARDFSLSARVRDLEAVTDALRLERFALYAFSAGGPTALAYADRHPERVSRMVLAATFLGAGSTSAEAEAFRRTRRGLRELARTSWDSPHARAAFAEFWLPEASAVERGMLMHFLQVSADEGAVAGFSEATETIDVSVEATRIRVPTLVVAGSEDRAIPLEFSRSLAAAVPGARFEILAGADHVEASTGDPRLMRMVSAFLAEDSPRSE